VSIGTLPELDDWDLNTVRLAASHSYFETEYLELKESISTNSDPNKRDRLAKTCAAFANSNGGYLVFGVKNVKGITADESICGVDLNYDFPEHFGVYPSKCSPSVTWIFKRPAIVLDKNKLVHVVFVPKSWNSPHAFQFSDGQLAFPKRTNKGNENMSVEEIKMMYLNQYEKRIRLQLLKSELSELKIVAAQIGNADVANDGSFFSTATFELSVINSVLAETYVLISQNQKLLSSLNQVRFHVRVMNSVMQMFFQRLTESGMDPRPIAAKHNEVVKPKCVYIIEQCELALKALDEVLST
jgi:hypothetical protein